MVFVLPIQEFLGASPVVVFQSIASGALGEAAFHEGLAAAGLGLGVHLFISLVAAGVCVLGHCDGRLCCDARPSRAWSTVSSSI